MRLREELLTLRKSTLYVDNNIPTTNHIPASESDNSTKESLLQEIRNLKNEKQEILANSEVQISQLNSKFANQKAQYSAEIFELQMKLKCKVISLF